VDKWMPALAGSRGEQPSHDHQKLAADLGLRDGREGGGPARNVATVTRATPATRLLEQAPER
jgi:hypothetical protein